MDDSANLLVLPSKSSGARLAPKMPQGSHRCAPCSPKGATEVPHATSRQPQGSPRGAPMGPPGSPKGATGLPHGTSRHPQGSHRGSMGATGSFTWYLWESTSGSLILGARVQNFESGRQITRSCKWYLWESESGCLILGVHVQDSESGREHLGVQSWEFLMSDSGSPNMPDRVWVSQPQKFNN